MEKLRVGAAVLAFATGDRTHALFLSAVEKVEFSVEVTPLPDAPRIVIGVINWRGRILPVLSMRRRLGLPERSIIEDDRLIIARSTRRLLALLVDGIVGMSYLSQQDIAAAGDIWRGIGGISGAAKIDADIVLIHDLDTFLDEQEEIALENALAETRGTG